VFKKSRKIVKGMPSAVLLSIVIHAALFLLAGMLVVFTVVKKEEKKFEPPKAVERPKMKLKKPKVKIKKTSKPKPTTRIVTKMNRASMPDIQLPEMSGMGEGLGGGIGGFDMMPDLDEVSVFGGGQSIGNDFLGTFYDFKRDRRGRNIPMSALTFTDILAKFVRNGWDASDFMRYYRSPKELYATSIMMPPILSSFGPEAFNEFNTSGYLWMVHYKGELVHHEDITFRFRGMGDDVLVVRVDGEVVLAASWPDGSWGMQNIGSFWQSDSADSRKYMLGGNTAEVGDWITLEAGVPLDMEVIIGEVPGGGFSALLVVEVEGVEYERNRQGGPILPMFKTTEPSLNLIEAIHEYLVPGEACVTNGPVFRDYALPGRDVAKNADVNGFPAADLSIGDSIDNKTRLWVMVDGQELTAEFVTAIGGKAVLKDSRGKQRKIPLSQLSEGDRLFIELADPPKFNIDFSKTSSQVMIEQNTPYIDMTGFPRTDFDYVFGAKLKQRTTGPYNHELQVEFFAVGEEVDGDNYILLDRRESTFTPSKENGRSHVFHGDPVRLTEFTVYQTRGQKYGGYLVVVTDSRGKIIDHGASHKWLLGILGNLRTLPLGKHFDKTGVRVGPPRPIKWY